MSQNVCSFCGNYHDSVTSACPGAQQKGETMPKGEGPLRKRVAKAIHRENDLCVRDEPWESGYECMCFPMADAAIAALQSVPSSPPPYPKSVSLDLEDYQRAAPSDAGQPESISFQSGKLAGLAEGKKICDKLMAEVPALERLREPLQNLYSGVKTFLQFLPNGEYAGLGNLRLRTREAADALEAPRPAEPTEPHDGPR